jgi:general secretion pathway protein J
LATGGCAGFTLLETLVALVVFSLLAATAYAGLRTSSTSWERAETRIQSREQQRAVVNFIRRQLTQAAPIARIGDGRWHLWFEGGPDQLTFLADVPQYLGQGGIHEIAFRRSSDNAKELLFLSQRIDPEAKVGEFASEQRIERVLVEDLGDFNIRYFGSPDGREDPRWYDRWEDERRLPRLVRVETSDAEGRVWAPVVVNVRADAVRFLRKTRPGAVPPRVDRPGPESDATEDGDDNSGAGAGGVNETDAPDESDGGTAGKMRRGSSGG